MISLNGHNPRVLFNTLKPVFNVPHIQCLENPSKMCEEFLHFCITGPPLNDHGIFLTCSAVLNQFEPVSLPFFEKIIGKMKITGSPNDVIPPRLFKEVFPTVAHCILDIVNVSLITGVVPLSFKHAVVQPLLKKPGLDQLELSNYRPSLSLSSLCFPKFWRKLFICG